MLPVKLYLQVIEIICKTDQISNWEKRDFISLFLILLLLKSFDLLLR